MSTDFVQQMNQFIQTHDLVRNSMNALKKYKMERKALESEIINELERQNVTIVNVNENKRIYRYSNPARLSVYHTRNLL